MAEDDRAKGARVGRTEAGRSERTGRNRSDSSSSESSGIVTTAPSIVARKWGAETPIVKQMIKQAQDFSKRYVLVALFEE